jgi:hypothetical protein
MPLVLSAGFWFSFDKDCLRFMVGKMIKQVYGGQNDNKTGLWWAK